ncbi:MAG: hypothetical protein IT379_11060 [Deltaproteobacteria bacterium]|nr:hypothetical protein [Deltaproteobacteria bacterium]
MLVFVVALAIPATVRASPQDLFGYGDRSAAMGSTGVAHAVGSEAAYSNPALLSITRQRTLSLGIHAAAFRLSIDDAPFPIDPGRANTIGVALPVPVRGPLADRLTLGAAFFTPHAVVVRGQVLYPDEPQFPVLQYRAQSVALMAAFGFGPVEGFRFGAGFSALASLLGDMSVALNAEGRFGSTVETQLIATFAPLAGVSYERGPLRVGAVVRGALDARFDFFVLTADLPIRLPPLTVGGVAQYDPFIAAVEGALTVGPWLFSAHLTYKRWSDYPGTQQRTSESSREPPSPGFSDTLVPRFGVERAFGPPEARVAFLRAGLFWEPSPAPEARPEALYLDADRIALTFGGGIDLHVAGDLHLRLDGHVQLHWMPPRDTGPASIDGAVTTAGWRVEASW